jgi:ribosome maturation factor RimP
MKLHFYRKWARPTFFLDFSLKQNMDSKIGKIEQQVEVFLKGTLVSKGYAVVGVDFLPHTHAGKVLRVYLDKEGGLSSEDCAKAHRMIEELMEDEPIEDLKYQKLSFEVCSPGARKQAQTK